MSSSSDARYQGPNLGMVATVFVALFCAGLYPVTAFAGKPFFPGPLEAPGTIVAYFQIRSSAVLLCAFFHFGAAISLGVFTASVVSNLQFLGVRAAGAYIALFGGLATALNMMSGSFLLWVMAHAGIAQDATLLQALYRLQFAFGGPGFSVPFGVLLAGVSVTAGLRKLLPKWIVVLGVAIAAAGELSWFDIIFPSVLFLIPLTRFPGFAWLIAAVFLLPKTHTGRGYGS
jgi:hypothetical protein